MSQFELRRVEGELREALLGTPLSWVLDDVDAAIAAGVPEEKILRRRQQRRGDDSPAVSPAAAAARYEVVDRRELGLVEYEASRKRGTLVIATRAMTDEERVQLLLEAVRRVLVELPEMEVDVLKTLSAAPEGDAGSRSVAEAVVFDPDEGARSRRGRTEFRGDRMPTERRTRLSDRLIILHRKLRAPNCARGNASTATPTSACARPYRARPRAHEDLQDPARLPDWAVTARITRCSK